MEPSGLGASPRGCCRLQDTGSATVNIPKGQRDLLDLDEVSQALLGKQSARNQSFPKFR